MIRILIVADVRFYREGLVQVLSHHPRLAVVGAAERGEEALRRVRSEPPDVVLLDAGLPNGLETARRIVGAAPAVQVVVVAVANSDADILDWAETGITGYVPRGGSLEELIRVVESAARGELCCPPRLTAGLARRLASLALRVDGQDRAASASALTARERQIADLIAEGMSNKRIARTLDIELSTAKNHVHNILQKLHVPRRGDAAALVRRSREKQAAGIGPAWI